jgi:hypothetical protein
MRGLHTIEMTKRVLMIAYHYPPCAVSSGQQRTLSFSRDLPKYGWEPIVLTASSNAYSRVGSDQLADIPPSLEVVRAWAFDTVRHLSFNGRYPGWLAVPDPWVSWFADATLSGLRFILKNKPQALWSTYPLATAHLIALVLHRLTGIPWIADFRDPMNEMDPVTRERWPKDPKIWWARDWIERHTIANCSRAVLVTQGALRIYSERYPELPASRWALIANGYSEESFAAAELLHKENRPQGGKITLLHSGVLYPSPDRNPGQFFAAIAGLREAGKISSENLQVVLRASSSEDLYHRQIREHQIEDIVTLEPPVAYNRALSEMLSVDGLLVFQGHDSNPAIPAKLYEYIRARRPIFAMVDDHGETAALLRKTEIGTLVPLDSKERITAGLLQFLDQIRNGCAPVAEDEEIERHSRRHKALELARLLDEVAAERGAKKIVAENFRKM